MEKDRNYYIKEIKRYNKKASKARELEITEGLLAGTMLLGGLILRSNPMLITSGVAAASILPTELYRRFNVIKSSTEYHGKIQTNNISKREKHLLHEVIVGNIETKRASMQELQDLGYDMFEIIDRTKGTPEDLYDINDMPSLERLEELTSRYATMEDVRKELTEEELAEMDKSYREPGDDLMFNFYYRLGVYRYTEKVLSKYRKETPVLQADYN